MVWYGCSSDAALSQLQFFFRILYGKMFFSLDFSCRRGSLFFERAWSGIFRRYLLKSSQRTGALSYGPVCCVQVLGGPYPWLRSRGDHWRTWRGNYN